MNNIPAIGEWKRIFIDTSFIIDCIRDLLYLKTDDGKYEAVNRSQALIDHIKLSEIRERKITWITSSIVLSELSKFENKDAVDELQKLFDSSDVEIVNFTKREARFMIDDLSNYIEQKHISQYIKELEKVLGEKGVFNPKNYISKDALIIACAKSKPCDVVITSDQNSFMPIAKQVGLPILLSKDIPLSAFDNFVDYTTPITTNY